MAEPVQSSYQYFVSIKLSKDDREYKWDPTVVEKNLPGFDKDKGHDEIHHSLRLTQVILDSEAEEGELNMIEVQTTGFEDEKPIVTPLGFLKAGSIYQSLVDMELPNSAVAFTLKKGSGPVHVVGLHTVTLSASEEDEEEGEDTGDEEAEAVAASEMESEPVAEVAQPRLSITTTNGVLEVKTNGIAAVSESTGTNDKKRKIDSDEAEETPAESEDGPKQNGTTTAAEEDGATAKKVKLVTDGDEGKPAETTEVAMEAEAATA